MSYGTSDSTVISPITTEAHNLNTTIASAAQRDNVFPANVQANTAENYQNHTFLTVGRASEPIVIHLPESGCISSQ